MLKGVDISKYQGSVNFDDLKGVVNFVIIKAGAGAPDSGQTAAQYADPQFTRNRDEVRRVGLLRGFYWYGYPEYNSPEAEAQCFHDVVGMPQDGELLVLDYESAWTGNKVDWCKRFLDHLSSLYNGYKPLIYLNHATTKANDWSSLIKSNYGLWLASWDYKPDAPMDPSTPWPFLAMRQYSNKENIAGLNPVDGDVFYGDATMFRQYGYHAPAPAPAPEPVPPLFPPEPTPTPQPVTPQPSSDALQATVATLQALTQKNQDLSNQLQKIQAQLDVLTRTNDNLQATLTDETNTNADKVARLNDQIFKQLGELATLQAKVDSQAQSTITALDSARASDLFYAFCRKIFGLPHA